ncbi:unnamed protein product [Sympodiomycopsis kandeliae]
MVNPKLCSHDELPSWCRDNGFIVSGYRRPGKGPQVADDADKGLTDQASSSATPSNGDATSSSTRQRRGEKSSNQQTASQTSQVGLFQHDTLMKCWNSMWAYTHNETVNIHTHFWGMIASILFLGLHFLHHIELFPQWLRPISHHAIFLPRLFRPSEDSQHILQRLHLPNLLDATSVVDHSANDWRDTAGFTIFLLCAISCLAFSSSYHTLQCHSHALGRKFNALDYVGIVNMIVGSFLPALHYGFYCHSHWQTFYGSCITILGAGAMWTVLSPTYATPEYRPYRTAVFLALGLSAVVPVAHGMYLYGYEILKLTMGLNYLVASGALYVAGALLYAMRVPERFAPGRFDYFGASHQIFHTFILLAAFSHYVCIRRAYTFWHTVQVVSPGQPGTELGNRALEIGKHAVCGALDAWQRS